MNILKSLVSCSGHWTGTNRLWISPDDPAEESPSSVDVVSVLDGRFLRIDQQWMFEGDSQTGSILLGFDSEADHHTAQWIDTFHMGDKVLTCVGDKGVSERFDVHGNYAAVPGPAWGWRIQVLSESADRLVIRMFNIHPDGKQDPAVEAVFDRIVNRAAPIF